MKVDILDALLASAVLYGVGSYLFWVNKTIITWTANAVFGTFKRQGAEDEEEEEWKKKKKKNTKTKICRPCAPSAEISSRHPCRSLTTLGKNVINFMLNTFPFLHTLLCRQTTSLSRLSLTPLFSPA